MAKKPLCVHFLCDYSIFQITLEGFVRRKTHKCTLLPGTVQILIFLDSTYSGKETQNEQRSVGHKNIKLHNLCKAVILDESDPSEGTIDKH